jgi:Mg-chelatase subunit ChlD
MWLFYPRRTNIRKNTDIDEIFLATTMQKESMRIQIALFLAILSIGAMCSVEEFEAFTTQNTDINLQQETDISYALIIDRSGSMREGNRFTEAITAATDFTYLLRSKDKAGVIGFDSKGTVYTQLTNESSRVRSAINRIRIGDFTQYHQGFLFASEMFISETTSDQQVAIFLSDGKPDDRKSILDASVQKLLDQEVCIFTIAYADAADKQAQEELQSIAERSNSQLGCGQYFRAQEDSYDLQRIYDEIFDVTTQTDVIEVSSEVIGNEDLQLSVSLKSKFNQQSYEDLACFTPDIELVILQDNQVVTQQQVTSLLHPIRLSAGNYNYIVRAVENCGGQCLYTGQDEGMFSVSTSQAYCAVTASQLASVVSTSDSQIIKITSQGFSPQTIGTEGVVTWQNVDSVAHQIQGLQGDFHSPVIQPGEEWSYAFGPGEYTFIDAETTLTGNVKNSEKVSDSKADVILILDRSGSMSGKPLQNAKSAAQTLTGILSPGDRASLIVFSDEAVTVQQLTSDIQSLQQGISSIRSQGSTFYADALRQAGQQLRASTSDRQQLVIFLSDGSPAESQQEILSILDENIGSSCLYTIGYGEEGQEAISLLSSMAEFIQEKNDCGLFYYSQATEEELSQVFGEIYALSTRQELKFINLSVESSYFSDTRISTMMFTETGKPVPYNQGNICLPPAEVQLSVGNKQYPITYTDQGYVASLNLPRGTYTATLTARIVPLDDPSRTVVGSRRVEIHNPSWTRILWILGGVILSILIFVKVFMRKANTS